nr:probable protein phosphatase 2C 65 [Ipomoea trifida]GMD40030.1 probable protein phosphatase 2C 65 [Ipomoea batatas]GMD43300.1 probable protein phosphatase 2C 65 [Ipomoea batatas]GMD62774.1 probable protein phosphatase 2C 65 [Ipomoea batatas]GME08817.1 probable protein phosphatase 2C 65 [Ipomoea batatas]
MRLRMGACCTCQRVKKPDGNRGKNAENREEREAEEEHDGIVGRGDCGARIRVHGSSRFVSMYSQQGKKGVNQDAMTVWEHFGGEKNSFFCGVFDGHGPNGHKVAQFIRDGLPSKLSVASKATGDKSHDVEKDIHHHPMFPKWKSNFLQSFKEMDERLEGEEKIDSFSSGTTSVTLIKQGEHLIIGNLGDSRAIMCTRDDTDQLVPEQLTVDLKPNLPSESERIKSCKGRVMATAEEPNVYRVWMPDQDCPGLAMARAFGDFCLKDYGIISVPEIYYRKISERDEFVVLASDGIWDVLSNYEVIKTVATARKRSMAARLVVERAVRTWKQKYPRSKTDDCAVVCLFFKRQKPMILKTVSQARLNMSFPETSGNEENSAIVETDDGLDTLLNYKGNEDGEDGGEQPDSAGRHRRRRYHPIPS